MMTPSIVCVGVNFKKTAVSEREKYSVARDDLPRFMQALCGHPDILESFVLSTCNRTEIYITGARNTTVADLKKAIRAVSLAERGSALTDADGAYFHEDMGAVRHLFKVCASLDSMVVGEPQILGQVKDAWREALRANSAGRMLHRVVERAFKAAKRVRNETDIASGAVSVSFVAVQLAQRIFPDLSKCFVLVIGAGEMAELTALHLHEAGVTRGAVANRSLQRARDLAEKYNWEASTLRDLPELLTKADIVVTSTGSPTHVLGVGAVRESLAKRQYRPLFLVDIALPRDVEPAAGNLDGAYLYNVDDLEELASQNRGERLREVGKAEGILDEELRALSSWGAEQAVAPTISGLRAHLLAIRDAELERSSKVLARLDPEELEAVKRLTQAMVDKVTATPARALRNEAARGGPAGEMAAVLSRAFELTDIQLVEVTGDSSRADELASRREQSGGMENRKDESEVSAGEGE